MTCPECGGDVVPVAKPGRVTRYKKMDLPVPAEMLIRTCQKCGDEYIHAKEAEAFDEAMEVVYRRHAVDELARLSQKMDLPK
jgi:rRNA maturation protein Nop10